ncbi:hypothetical protein [Streptomyces sp. KMM 9044]|uniref:hypothetical protein n=2 Tax=Streptomyces TaxID=1883 RepID=UPI0021516F9D|nr:hypothetical protein [Streptomyces sp. KMM 9044]WAX82173.1 hypothetical protein HUV60_016300 [Streptomyces sp. KMM 9044]
MSERSSRNEPSVRETPGGLHGEIGERRVDLASEVSGVAGVPGMTGPPGADETDAERRRRRARFLRELAEARELRDRVQPRRAKAARLRHAMRMRTFRW